MEATQHQCWNLFQKKKFWLCFCLIHYSLIFFSFAFNDSYLPQQGGNSDRCVMGCVVLDWEGGAGLSWL